MSSNLPNTRSTAGFGLVELLVSMSIMTLVSTIVLVNQNSFNSAIVLRNQTYEVAFMLRQAQLAAVSGTSDRTSDGQRFGVQIDSTENTITFFSDVDNSGTYNTSAGDILLERRRLDRRFQVDAISIGGTNVAVMHVIFERPNFDALLFDATGTSYSGVAEVVIGNQKNAATRSIEINDSGNISVTSN